MKVTFSPAGVYRNNYTRNSSANSVSSNRSASLATPKLISFGGKYENQIAVIAAEAGPYAKVGGVGSVAQDYISRVVFNPGVEPIFFMPYYNGQRFYNEKGELVKDVAPLRSSDGKVFYTNVDLKTDSIDNISPGKKWELDMIGQKSMDWAGGKENVAIYQVKNDKVKHFMIYTEDTARMPKPYANGGYSTEGVVRKLGDGGTAEAKAMKALVEFLPELENKGISPGYFLCNDAQTAHFIEYVARKAQLGDPYYKEIFISFIQHNLGDGYQGLSSHKEMFYNFASNEQVKAVMADPGYFQALKQGNEEDYFKQFFKKVSTDPGALTRIQRADKAVVASMIPIRYALSDNLNGVAPVSEEYAQSTLDNPKVAVGLREYLIELKKKNRFRGILNGMNNANIDPTAVSGLPFYSKPVKYEPLGIEFKPFETYDPKWFETMSELEASEKIQAIKNRNKVNLLERLQEGIPSKFSIGQDKPEYSLIGNISREWLEKAKNGGVNLFVSWGRADEQKGLDIVMDAFQKFVENNNDDKSLLVLGGELKGSACEQMIKMKMNAFLSNPKLKGRVVFMNGFAPNSILAAAGDAAMFPSRFAPCELTDLEAMKYGATPMVTDLQGLKQKNFDPRRPEEASKAASYKTQAHSFMPEEDLLARDAQYKEVFETRKKVYEKELQLAKIKGQEGAAFTPERIAELVEEKLKSDGELRMAYKEATDRLISDDLATALVAKVSETPEQRAKMIKNAMLVKCGWRENAALHGVGQGHSGNIYHEFLFNKTAKGFTDTIFDYGFMPTSSASSASAGAGARNRNFVSSGFDSFGSASRFFNKKVLSIAAGVVALGGVGYYLFKGKSETKKHASQFIA